MEVNIMAKIVGYFMEKGIWYQGKEQSPRKTPVIIIGDNPSFTLDDYQADDDIMFVKKKRDEYDELFTDAKTAISSYDNFIKQLNLFTVKQDIYNIKPKGKRKIILLK